MSSLLPSLVANDVKTQLIDLIDIDMGVMGALQHSASEMVTSSLSLPCPYPLQIQLIDATIVLFGRAFPLAAMKHRAQVTAHFIECLRQAKKDRALYLQIEILGAYAMALKSLSMAKGTVGDDVICAAWRVVRWED